MKRGYEPTYRDAQTPSRLKYTGTRRRRVEQGGQTLNIRASAAEKLRRDENARSGVSGKAYPGYGEAMMNIHQNDCVFAFRSSGPLKAYGLVGGKVAGFSTLNGLSYAEYMNEDELMEKMFFVGISKVPYYLDAMLPQEDVGQEEGFAVYIAGTITTRNTGTQKIYPGDPVAWRVPAFHNSPRAKMTGAGVVRGQVLPYQRVAKEGGRSRITPFIYPVSKTSYRELGQHIYHTIVRRDDRGIGRIDYRALLAEKDVAGSTMQHAAALYAKTKLVELTEGIRALQQCGAVMITPPDLRAAIEAQLGNPAGNFRGAWIAAQRTLTVGATLGSVAFSGPLNHYENNSYLRLNRKSHLGPVDAETAQTRVNDATAWLSARLGVARDGTGRIRENTNWSGGVLGAVLASHNPDREEAQQFGAVVDGAAGLGPRGKSSGSRLILQHRLMNEKAGSLSFSSIVHALSTLNSRTIGVAIGTGAGADNVDLLVGHNPLAIV